MIPTPSNLIKAKSSVYDLKERLDWGEPALTIIDIRNREAFNVSHIMGAISIPMNELLERVQSNLETVRDIYVYGSTDEDAAQAVDQLRQAGYTNVSELTGGLGAWKAVGYAIEGNPAIIA